MKIDAGYGCDTGMYLVDVYLETEREHALEFEDIWRELGPLFAAEGIPISGIADCFLHKQGREGNWVCAGTLPWGGPTRSLGGHDGAGQ